MSDARGGTPMCSAEVLTAFRSHDNVRLPKWHPVAGSGDLVQRHVFEAQLFGQELAIWRSNGGAVNVWENRCPHRSIRLSLGANMGESLRCAYHGFRYKAATGQCCDIPSERGRRAPTKVSVKTFPAMERLGLIWTTLDATASCQLEQLPSECPATKLYSMPVNASAIRVAEYLGDYSFRPTATLNETTELGETNFCWKVTNPLTVEATASLKAFVSRVLLVAQPVSEAVTVVHGCLLEDIPCDLRMPALRHHCDRLSALRAVIELDTTA